MSQLEAVTLILVALSAVASLIGLSMGLYELVTGRLMPVITVLRRRVPATAGDLRENALALVLNEVAVLLMLLPILASMLPAQARFNPILTAAFFAVSLAGLLGAGACAYASFSIKRKVQMVKRTGGPQQALTNFS